MRVVLFKLPLLDTLNETFDLRRVRGGDFFVAFHGESYSLILCQKKSIAKPYAYRFTFFTIVYRREPLHHFERRVPRLGRRNTLLRLPQSVNGRSEQFEEAVAVQGKPVSGEPAAELTVIVDRNLSRRYDNIPIDLGTAVDRQVAADNV